MKLELSTDRQGGLLVKPVSKVWQKKIDSHLKEYKNVGAPQKEGSKGVYIQDNWESCSILNLSPTNINDLNSGWTVKIIRDDFESLHLWGWDCNELA